MTNFIDLFKGDKQKLFEHVKQKNTLERNILGIC